MNFEFQVKDTSTIMNLQIPLHLKSKNEWSNYINKSPH